MSKDYRFVKSNNSYRVTKDGTVNQVGIAYPPRLEDPDDRIRVRTGIDDSDVKLWFKSDVEKIGMWEFIKSATYWYEESKQYVKKDFFNVMNNISLKWVPMARSIETISPADDYYDEIGDSPFIGGDTAVVKNNQLVLVRGSEDTVDVDDEYNEYDWYTQYRNRKIAEKNRYQVAIDELKAWISSHNELSLTNNLNKNV